MATDISAIFNNLLSSAGNALDPNKVKEALTGITDLAQQSGGLSGLLDQLRNNGLADQVNSWVGEGSNLSVSPDQLRDALGPDKLKEAADKAGTTVQDLSTQMAAALPQLVDKLSPQGAVPGLDQATELLGKLPGGAQVGDFLQNLLGGNKSE